MVLIYEDIRVRQIPGGVILIASLRCFSGSDGGNQIVEAARQMGKKRTRRASLYRKMREKTGYNLKRVLLHFSHNICLTPILKSFLTCDLKSFHIYDIK